MKTNDNQSMNNLEMKKGIIGWVMIANRFFSSQVRIQTDRGHTVIKDGPYRIVRHPAYAGVLLAWLAAPVFFSSW